MATLRQALIQTVASLIPPLGALIAERNRLRRELQLVGETDRLTGEGDQPLAGLSMQETRSEVCFQKYIYFGNLFPHQAQYHSDLFVGLALNKPFDKDILHDARQPLPFKDNSIIGFQSEDVFEHLEFDRVKSVFDEIFRCLRPGGLFRLSLPDYNSPLLRSRSVYDCDGFLLCDLAMGGSVRGAMNGGLTVSFTEGGTLICGFRRTPTYCI